MLIAVVFTVAFVVGPLFVMPWPASNDYLVLLRAREPVFYEVLKWIYFMLWGSSFALGYVVIVQVGERMRSRSLKPVEVIAGKAPVPVPPDQRENLEVVLGVVYDPKELGKPSATPRLAVIPELGLYTGLIAIASPGSGKTRYVLTPIADQVFGWKCLDADKKVGGLVLEVKGNFCDTIHETLSGWGREADYVELRPGGPVKYNPIDPGMSPSAIASTINNLMVNLYGESNEKYWSQVTGEAIKNIVSLFRRCQNGHCTLHDILLAMADQEFLAERIKAEVDKAGTGAETLIVSLDEYAKQPENVERQGFVIEQVGVNPPELRAPFSKALWDWLKARKVPYFVEIDITKKKDTELASIIRWYTATWLKLRADIRTSVTSGITPFLGLFDSDPQLLETFCPAADDEGLFAGWEDAIETGKVVAVKFDMITDTDMARLLGVFIKQAYQRAVLRRIPKMSREPGKHYRQTVLIIDECQDLLTVGLVGFGDDKFLAKHREAKCMPMFATQSISSLRAALRGEEGANVILGNLKSKLFGHLEDLKSAEYASKICGDEEQWIPHVSIGESGQKSRVSVLGKGTISNEASVTANKGYNEQMRAIWRPHVFMNELRVGQAIARISNGTSTETMVVYQTPDAVPFEVN